MNNLRKLDKNKSVFTGSGLLTLDVILNGDPTTPAKLCTGGSFGNIAAILSFLGWESKPIARLSNNSATKSIVEDLKKFEVNIELLTTSKDGSTPIIIHRILKDKQGNPKHRFEFKVPGSKDWLPGYKPVLSSDVESIIKKQNKVQVFYFDRVCRSAIDLANYYKNEGALIVFEPSSYKQEKQFEESLKVADIIKCSSERISNYSQLFPMPIAPLEIVTLGKEGLTYRLKSYKKNKWTKIHSFKLNNIIDSAGAGDWCTAGVINQLGQSGIKSFNRANEKDINDAIMVGQALGALNCMFDGSRGIMYNMTYDSLRISIKQLLNKKDFKIIEHSSNIKIRKVKNLKFEALLK